MLDPSQYSTLAQQTTPDALALLTSQLEQLVGEDAADELLAKVDRLLGAKPETDAMVAQGLRKEKKALAKLSGTTGLQWGVWMRGYYVVTFDGKHIGNISSGGSSGGRRTSWRPRVLGGGPLSETYRTVQLAAEAIAEAAGVRST